MQGQGNETGSVWALTGAYGSDPADAARLVGRVAAVLSIGAGVVHISAAADHTNLPVMLAGFLVVATLQVALGGLLLWRRPSGMLIVAALALMVGSIGVWLISRTLGLPFLPGGHMEPVGFKDGVTVLFELGTIPALLLLLSSELSRISLPSPRLGTQALAVVGAASFLMLVPALVAGGGAHHSHDEAVAMGIHEHESGHEDGEHADEHALAESESGHGHKGGEHADDAEHGALAQQGGADHAHAGDQLAGALGGAHDVGHTDGAAEPHGDSHAGGPDDHGSQGHGDSGGGHGHRGDTPGEQGGGGQGHGDHPGGDHPDEGGHPEGEHGGGGHGAEPGEENDGSFGIAYEPARPAENGEPARGGAIVWRSDSLPYEKGAHSGEFHHGSSEGCKPTPEQQAIADKLYVETDAELSRYENNPALAIADGFSQVVGPADRFVHMINFERVFSPTILKPTEIESFMYAQTDRGLVPLGGMYILPAEFKDGKVVPSEPKHGPEVAGCLTRWHKHEGWVAGVSTGGTNWEETPEMLHVWTYPGFDPWSHYDGPELSQTWAFWKDIPSFCRISPGGTNVCFP